MDIDFPYREPRRELSSVKSYNCDTLRSQVPPVLLKMEHGKSKAEIKSLLKKNLKATKKPPEQSKGFGWNIGCKNKNSTWLRNECYHIVESAVYILYTDDDIESPSSRDTKTRTKEQSVRYEF